MSETTKRISLEDIGLSKKKCFTIVRYLLVTVLCLALPSYVFIGSEVEEVRHVSLELSNERTGIHSKGANNTVVTAYYEFDSKHSNKLYWQWIEHFLLLEDPMVVFTSADLAPRILQGRAHALNKTKVVILELNETNTAKMFSSRFWKRQYAMDPEKEVHRSYLVYWVWLSKIEFVKRAIDMNHFQSEFFAWVDIGYFRDGTYNGQKMLQHIPPALQEEQIVMLQVYRSIGGGFIGGYIQGLLRWHDLFYKLLRKRKSKFIGKDQPLMLKGCLEEFPSPCLLVKPPYKGYGMFSDWMFMAPFMSLGQNATNTSTWVPAIHEPT